MLSQEHTDHVSFRSLMKTSMSVISFPLIRVNFAHNAGIPEFATATLANARSVLQVPDEDFINIRIIYDHRAADNKTICKIMNGDQQIKECRYCAWCMLFLKTNSTGNHKENCIHQYVRNMSAYSYLLKNTYSLLMQAFSRKHALCEMNDRCCQYISPLMQESRLRSYINELVHGIRNVIIAEISTVESITLHMDGWTKVFNYEGVEVSYNLAGKEVKRFLGLLYLEGASHNVMNMSAAVDRLKSLYHIGDKIKILVADSTNFNPAFASGNNLDFDPCKCHQLNNVFKRFKLPGVFNKVHECVGRMGKQQKLHEYFHEKGAKSLTTCSNTRWLTEIPTLVSFLGHFDHILKYCSENSGFANQIGFSFNDVEMYVLQGCSIYLKEIYKMSTSLEDDDNYPGHNEVVLENIMLQIELMKNDDGLSVLVPNWTQICQELLVDFRNTFFESASDACARNLAAGLLFNTNSNKFYYHDKPVQIDHVKKWMKTAGFDLNVIQREIKQVDVTKLFHSDYLMSIQNLCPNVSEFARYLMRFTGNNASLERIFSVITKILVSWRPYQPDMANKLAIIENNWNLSQLLIIGRVPDEIAFCNLFDELKKHFLFNNADIVNPAYDVKLPACEEIQIHEGLTIPRPFDQYNNKNQWRAKIRMIYMIIAQNQMNIQWMFFAHLKFRHDNPWCGFINKTVSDGEYKQVFTELNQFFR